MTKFFKEALKHGINFILSPKGIVAPPDMCGDLTPQMACATLEPLAKAAGLRISWIKPSIEYPDPQGAVYVGPAREEKSIEDSHKAAAEHLKGLLNDRPQDPLQKQFEDYPSK